MTAFDGLEGAFAGRLLTAPEDIAPYLTDWRKNWTGAAMAVAQPETTEAVAAVVRWCAASGARVIPQGGNTGLSGGATPDDRTNNIVLSLVRMKAIRELDAVNNTITVEAGCILSDVQNAANEAGRLFPLSLAAEGSCTIGGNLATNAGGTGVLRYGNARELCLGIEVVTANGDVWNGLRGLRKDNTGYDLRDLFIGSEGTLGVITAAVLKLYPAPAGRSVAIAAVPDPSAAITLMHLAQERLAGNLSGLEIFSETCLELVLAHSEGAQRPIAEPAPWYCLIEASSMHDVDQAAAQMSDMLEEAFERDLVRDAAISASAAQAEALWALREDISEAQRQLGTTIKHDVSLPLSSLAQFIAATEEALAAHFPQIRTGVFGHVGDGNLHFNVLPRDDRDGAAMEGLTAAVNTLVHDLVAAHNGSVSAEHGVGVLRRDEVARYKSPVEMALMKQIKAAFDPDGIMNPGKVLC